MGIADTIRGAIQGVANEGAERAQAVADARKRSKLISELGEMTYRRSKGEAIDDSLVEAVVARIDELGSDSSGDDDGQPTDETSPSGGGDPTASGGDNGATEQP